MLRLTISLVLVFILTSCSVGSDLHTVDQVLRQSGINIKDFRVFKSTESFALSPNTSGAFVHGNDVVGLRIIGGSLSSIHYIRKLSKLENLTIFGSQLTSLEGLQDLVRLQYLDVADNKIASFSPLVEMRSLEVARIGGNLTGFPLPLEFYGDVGGVSLEVSNNKYYTSILAPDIRKVYGRAKHESSEFVGDVIRIEQGEHKGELALSFKFDLEPGNYSIKIATQPSSVDFTGGVFGSSIIDNFAFRPSFARKEFLASEMVGNQLFEWDLEVPDTLNYASFLLVTAATSEPVLIERILVERKNVTPLESESIKVLRDLMSNGVNLTI